MLSEENSSNFKFENNIDYLSTKMISIDKDMNYKVIDLDESYNFYILSPSEFI
jgi:hypothetical protein